MTGSRELFGSVTSAAVERDTHHPHSREWRVWQERVVTIERLYEKALDCETRAAVNGRGGAATPTSA